MAKPSYSARCRGRAGRGHMERAAEGVWAGQLGSGPASSGCKAGGTRLSASWAECLQARQQQEWQPSGCPIQLAGPSAAHLQAVHRRSGCGILQGAAEGAQVVGGLVPRAILEVGVLQQDRLRQRGLRCAQNAQSLSVPHMHASTLTGPQHLSTPPPPLPSPSASVNTAPPLPSPSASASPPPPWRPGKSQPPRRRAPPPPPPPGTPPQWQPGRHARAAPPPTAR